MLFLSRYMFEVEVLIDVVNSDQGIYMYFQSEIYIGLPIVDINCWKYGRF